MRKLFMAVVLSVGLIGPAQAGIPFNRPVTCPIDGREFTVRSTLSCTQFGYRMSLGPISSCDWITRLPICPGSGFPVYRDFTPGEAEAARILVDTPGYAAARARSPWYLAWFVETRLGGDPVVGLRLLISGLGFDRAAFDSPDYRAHILKVSTPLLPRLEVQERGMIRALGAFLLIHQGDTEAASAVIRTLRHEPDPPAQYLDAIEACIADRNARTCDPDQPIREP